MVSNRLFIYSTQIPLALSNIWYKSHYPELFFAPMLVFEDRMDGCTLHKLALYYTILHKMDFYYFCFFYSVNRGYN
jgi:hypothetical protein